MASRTQLIEKLVSTLHLNVHERQTLDRSALRVSEVNSAVKRLLLEAGRFPSHAKPWQHGEVAFEGHFLELLIGGSVRLWWQRSHPLMPTRMAEQHHSDFASIDDAIEAFVNKEWASGIDGIRIVPG